MSQIPGKFISLEGGEGAGKSTQVKRLAEWLESQGIAALATREPGGAPGAEAIRTLLVEGATDKWAPTTELLLHMAARSEHIERTIQPALSSGRWVISDRFVDSTRAYQGAGQGNAPALIDRLHELLFDGLMPDLTLLLDLPAEEGLKRAQMRRATNRYEQFGPDFHGRLRQAFLDLAAIEPARFHIIDASLPLETVSDRIRDAVALRLLS